jgi:hypothetical protein
MEIANVVMLFHLKELPNGSKETILQFARKFSPCGAHGLVNTFSALLNGEVPLGNYRDRNDMYWRLIVMYAKKKIILSTFNRHIGNMATQLNISNIQLKEFFRLLFIDIVNSKLGQTQDEAPLFSGRQRQGRVRA